MSKAELDVQTMQYCSSVMSMFWNKHAKNILYLMFVYEEEGGGQVSRRFSLHFYAPSGVFFGYVPRVSKST